MKNIPVRKIATAQKIENPQGRFSIRAISDVLKAKDIIHDLHRHDFYFILTVDRGSGIHEIDFTQFIVENNSVFILRPGQVHQLELKCRGWYSQACRCWNLVGGSYAGLATAMALGRALRYVLVIDGGDPCNKQTPHSHNFLTNDGKTPSEIVALARKQVKSYRCVTLLNGVVTNGKKTDEGFHVELASGEKYMSRKLVFATGIKDILPAIPGFAECWGISVLHCPYCHGFEVRRFFFQ